MEEIQQALDAFVGVEFTRVHNRFAQAAAFKDALGLGAVSDRGRRNAAGECRDSGVHPCAAEPAALADDPLHLSGIELGRNKVDSTLKSFWQCLASPPTRFRVGLVMTGC